jgi:RHS repeat-associated protein
VIQSWFSVEAGMGQLAWLHTNHLGAPEATTNTQGQLVWQARYEAFGAAHVNEGTSANSQTFTLNLRLPGQYFDAETGLHYNRQRYYDPQAGQYLTPDPLGTPDGPNPYAYVRFNPLGYVDPEGLILFAFDGTGNSRNTASCSATTTSETCDPSMQGGTASNVVQFLNRYRDGKGEPNYVSGVGTYYKDDKYDPIIPEEFADKKLLDYLTGSDPLYVNDMGGNYSGPARINRMMLYMRDESDSFKDNEAMDIDIVGFSRGGAEARDFANRITQSSTTVNGKKYYQYKDSNGKSACQWVNFRFMGLWDTVLSTNFSGTGYQLGIPSQFAYVAQAVALNEHRSGNLLSYGQRAPLPYSQHWGGFPLESIGASSTAEGATRIELGFLGSHADIGGGFADNELSKVPLAWMIEQATKAGVKMDESPISITASAVLHDKSNNIQTGKPDETCALCTGGEDRSVNGAVSGDKQRSMSFSPVIASMTYADTGQFITYLDRASLERYTTKDVDKGSPRSFLGQLKTDATGTINIDAYVAWLKLNGYGLKQLQVQK